MTEDPIAAIRAADVLGTERTLVDDVDFGLRQLADIAVKALSPGINDPTTATDCLDRLAELIGRIVRKEPLEGVRHRQDNHISLFVTRRSVAHMIDTAFTQIRVYGAGDVIVMTHFINLLGQLASIARPMYRSALEEQALHVLAAIQSQNYLPGDRARIESAAHWVS